MKQRMSWALDGQGGAQGREPADLKDTFEWRGEAGGGKARAGAGCSWAGVLLPTGLCQVPWSREASNSDLPTREGVGGGGLGLTELVEGSR